MKSNQARVHETSFIGKDVQLGNDVQIGPFCYLDGNIVIGDGNILHSHVVMSGKVTVGPRNQFFPFSCIGSPPQDLSYKGEETEVIIDSENIFREYVSVHRGTLKQDLKTVIGSKNFIMAYVHIGHDAWVGNQCIIVNSVNLAGHVKLMDHCIVGGGTNISQFVTLGKGSYIGGASGIDKDIPPFCCAYGNRIKMKGVNIVGLKRKGYNRKLISEFVEFYRCMESSLLSPRAFIDREYKNFLEENKEENSLIGDFVNFINTSALGIAPFVK